MSPASRAMLAGAAYDLAVSVGLGLGFWPTLFALVPLEGAQRGDGRRTLVYVDGIEQPLVASRSEAAIVGDLASSLELEGPRGRRGTARAPGQEALF